MFFDACCHTVYEHARRGHALSRVHTGPFETPCLLSKALALTYKGGLGWL
jgi:hypothetical protein